MEQNKNLEPFWVRGLRFECTQCGRCCRHDPGYVFLSYQDVGALACHFRVSEQEFTESYCRRVQWGPKKRLSLLERPGNDCIFWDNGCTVYESRPLQCRSYPFWQGNLASQDDWDSVAAECPGVDRGRVHSGREISSILEKRDQEILISLPQ